MITRLVRPADAAELCALLRANRDFLAPWDPIRAEDYFTEEGQRAVLEGFLAAHAKGTILPHVILDGDRIVGRITLSGITRGAFQSGNLGYWVNAQDNGRGLGTAAVAEIRRIAFYELGLHRIEAGTLLHNTASQTVLHRNGFVRFGTAPRYLRIAGVWQDHALFQTLNE